MKTLLLRLEGPMQSWGTQSRFSRRDTGLEPSKSGVIGLLSAALGRPRDADLSDLCALRMGVRVDREGRVVSDYQTAGGIGGFAPSDYGVATFDNSQRRTVVTVRFYLADASFLIGLEAPTSAQEDLLTELDRALAHPVWPLFLGRKAFVPALPVRLPDIPPYGPGLRSQDLVTALRTYPWPETLQDEHSSTQSQRQSQAHRLRLVIEDESSTIGESRMDAPVSFDPLNRRYQLRFVRTEFVDRPPATSATPAMNEPPASDSAGFDASTQFLTETHSEE